MGLPRPFVTIRILAIQILTERPWPHTARHGTAIKPIPRQHKKLATRPQAQPVTTPINCPRAGNVGTVRRLPGHMGSALPPAYTVPEQPIRCQVHNQPGAVREGDRGYLRLTRGLRRVAYRERRRVLLVSNKRSKIFFIQNERWHHDPERPPTQAPGRIPALHPATPANPNPAANAPTRRHPPATARNCPHPPARTEVTPR